MSRINVRPIRAWMAKHPDFVETMDTFAFEIAKGSWGKNDKFDANFLKEMLSKEYNYTKLGFHAWELLWVWKKYHPLFSNEY